MSLQSNNHTTMWMRFKHCCAMQLLVNDPSHPCDSVEESYQRSGMDALCDCSGNAHVWQMCSSSADSTRDPIRSKSSRKKLLKKPGWYKRLHHQLTPAQRRSCATLLPLYRLPLSYGSGGPKPLDFAQAFGRNGPQEVTLDVGCGHGDSLVAMAQENPHGCFIGTEWHKASVGSTLQKIHDLQLSNCRVVYMEFTKFLDHVPDGGLTNVCIFFPDPWLKEVDVERRVVRSDTVAALAQKLRPEGVLRIATDVDDYRDWVVQTMGNSSADWMVGDPKTMARSFVTLYEQRAWNEGREVHELLYIRR